MHLSQIFPTSEPSALWKAVEPWKCLCRSQLACSCS